LSVRPHRKQGADPRFSDAWIIDFYDETIRWRVTCYGAEDINSAR
jgi:hypothetical protein